MSPVMKGVEWLPKNKTAHLSRVYILAASLFLSLLHTHKLSWVSADAWVTSYLYPTSFFPLPDAVCLPPSCLKYLRPSERLGTEIEQLGLERVDGHNETKSAKCATKTSSLAPVAWEAHKGFIRWAKGRADIFHKPPTTKTGLCMLMKLQISNSRLEKNVRGIKSCHS